MTGATGLCLWLQTWEVEKHELDHSDAKADISARAANSKVSFGHLDPANLCLAGWSPRSPSPRFIEI